VPQKVLRRALSEVTFAAATDETRPILTGVLTRFAGEVATLAAADNYRIAVKTLDLLSSVEETSIVVPARSYAELMRVLGDTDEPVDIILAQAKNQVIFRVDTTEVVSRLIDGQFPNYQQVMPQSHATRAVLDREELLRAVRPAALIAHESANIVKLQIGGDAEPGITVSANAEVGDHVGQVEASVEGDGTTIAFNARYLADVLTNVTAEQFALELNGPLSPGVFKPIGDDQYVHVVMPVRTTS
jgi:DNA polymerase-3 subunit beta